jgi:hypothetical protein
MRNDRVERFLARRLLVGFTHFENPIDTLWNGVKRSGGRDHSTARTRRNEPIPRGGIGERL